MTQQTRLQAGHKWPVDSPAEAAGKLRRRALAGDVYVKVLTPSTPGTDWCDLWARRDGVEVSA